MTVLMTHVSRGPVRRLVQGEGRKRGEGEEKYLERSFFGGLV